MHRSIPVSEIMVRDVVTAPPAATVMDAATLMREEHTSSVLVVRDGTPVGIVTEGTFATCLCERETVGHLELESVMSSPLITVTPGTSIVDTVSLLRANEIEHLPVVDGQSAGTDAGEPAESEAGGSPALDGELVGIVTTTELSYFVPHAIHPLATRDASPPRRQVRTDTEYERDDWSFEYRGEDESTVSVGDVAQFSKTLTPEDVASFAEVTGDTNRLHLDEDYAQETRFGTRIVHGVLANGLISAALARLPGLTIYLSQESTFMGPIPVGSRATAICEVVDDLGRSKYRVETTVLDGEDEPVLEGESVVMIDELPPEQVAEGEATA